MGGKLGFRIQSHLNSARHKKQLTVFEGDKSSNYLQAESDFVQEEDQEVEAISVEDDIPSSSSTPPVTDNGEANDEEFIPNNKQKS
jgi:hypothetical protein